jgi:PAS domain S-box-containing protein
MSYDMTNPFTISFLCVTAVLWGLAGVSLRHRTRRGPRLLGAVLLVMSLWSLGDAMRFAAPDAASILLWDRVRDTGIIFLAPTIFLFVAHYTDKHRWLTRKYAGTLYLISGGFFIVSLVNPRNLWRFVETVDPGTPPPVFVEGRGLLWYVFAIYGPAVAAASYYLIFTKMAEEKRAGIYRSQSLLVGIGILTPILLTSFFLLNLVPFDPTPLGFGVTGVTFGIAIFRYDLLDVTPVARDTVISTTSSGVLVVDSDGTIVDANAALSDILDRPKDELIGNDFSSLRSGFPHLLDQIHGLHDGTQTVTISQDGTRRHYDVTVSPVQTEADGHAGRVIIFNDATETVENQRELRERTAELERQNERLDRFASLVSHDLRTPLQLAQTYTELAEQSDGEPDFESIHEAHERMDAMIDDLLTMSRAGRTIDETTVVSLDTVARESWIHTETEDVEFESAVPEDAVIQADPGRLRQLFENLFRNATEHGVSDEPSVADAPDDAVEHGLDEPHSDNDGPTLSVSVGILETDDGDLAGFFVEDDGTGIPEDERDTIFEYGYTTSADGTGFGLAIVSEVVEAHGWDLSVTESEAGGARFEICT